MFRSAIILSGIFASVLTFTSAGQARERHVAPADVTVWLHSSVIAPPGAIERAKLVAKTIFAGIGINLAWRTWSAHQSPAENKALNFDVRLTANEPGTEESEVLAEAYPFSGGTRGIVVNYDRVHNAAGVSRDLEPLLLAHVLVHELTHVLQCVDRHSDTGIMKARWTSDDYADMRWKPLEFSAEDIELIHLGIQSLRSHVAPDPVGQ